MGSVQAPKQTLPWVETPVIESHALSKAAGCSKTFSPRDPSNLGIGNYMINRLADLPAGTPTPSHFYCVSGGNAGLACIVAAVSLGHKASIIVPLTCAKSTIDRLYNAGATSVVQHGKSLQEADNYLKNHALVENPSGIYVPPFDHADIWAGNATVMEELGWQFGADAPDAVICSVGGGGLLCGVVEGIERLNWTNTEVVAVETSGADSLAKSLSAGKNSTLEGITSAATSLGCVRVADKAFEYATQKNSRIRSVVLEDKEAAMGCLRFTDDERFMVELACGVNAAVCYKGILGQLLKRGLTEQSKVVVILCGGSNVNLEIMAGWRELYGL